MGALRDPLRAAQALRATIRATRQETEEARRLAPQVVEGLLDAGLCRLAVPASLGGHEAAPVVALQVYEELAWADASVAWIAWNNQLVGLASRYASDAVRTEIFSDARRLFANSTRPSGRAVVVEGGFRVSGRWSLVSGCELADWIPVMCVITEGTAPRLLPAGMPEMRMAYLPKGAYRILDTWYVGGLRGTGSHDIVVEDLFVPAERTFFFTDPVQLDRPLSRMPFFATMCAGCAALCLGIAQAATDTLLELGASKVQVDPFPGLRERAAVQVMVASAAAKLDAARLLLHAALDDLWAACTQGTPVTDAQRARMWESGHHAAQTAKAVATSMYEAAGTSALYIDCPIERAHRDIYAVMQHVVFAPMWLEAAGRVRFGLTPQNPLF
ncbi:MAG TPA: acyl-CoA dehydrogenase family protein [Alphaproteobacteria bacterium]|nr:acyl-CoA dehydrogenase family protein [Alphaproteobacteria bacterium]